MAGANLQVIRGVLFPGLIFKKENFENTMDMIPQDGDIILASYPKTGTTFLQYTVLQIMSKGESLPSMDDVTHKIVPFLEMTGIKALDSLSSPRTYKHHIPYNMVQKNENAKYIYIYRKPEDTLVSYYHFSNNFQTEKIDFDEFFEDFLSGNTGYGRYFEHVLSFFAHKGDRNLLLISYENLLKNRREEILRIAKFLGEEYYQNLITDESALEKILEHTSFDYMKKNLFIKKPDFVKQKKTAANESENIQFFRKGIIGDGKMTLSSEQLQRLREVMEDVMEGTELIEEWLKEWN